MIEGLNGCLIGWMDESVKATCMKGKEVFVYVT